MTAGGDEPPALPTWLPQPLTHDQFLKLNTGWAKTEERWRADQVRRVELEADDTRLADALEAEGIRVRQGRPIVAVGLVTGRTQIIESVRAIRFLPSIAQRDRRPMLNALRLYRANHPLGSYLRHAVVTSGARVPLGGDLRGRIEGFHRKLSKFADIARRRFGVEVVYRGTEFTIDARRSFHVHAHVLFAPRTRLATARWSGFLSWMHAFFDAHFYDAGRLVKPDEAIKYPFKPADLRHLDGPGLAWLYHQTARLKVAQPLGDFRDFCRELNANGLKVLLVNHPDGGRLHLVRKPSRPPRSAGDRTGGGPFENTVVCVMAPHARFCRYAEPVALVERYSWNPESWEGLLRRAELQDRQAEARRWWDANGAPDPASLFPTDPADRP